MKDKTLILTLFLLMFHTTCYAIIYEQTDEHGNITYSDRPIVNMVPKGLSNNKKSNNHLSFMMASSILQDKSNIG
jgi:hypothetical protein